MAAESHELLPARRYVGAQPREGLVLDEVDKDVMVDGVERRPHVKADQSSDFFDVDGHVHGHVHDVQ